MDLAEGPECLYEGSEHVRAEQASSGHCGEQAPAAPWAGEEVLWGQPGVVGEGGGGGPVERLQPLVRLPLCLTFPTLCSLTTGVCPRWNMCVRVCVFVNVDFANIY